MFKFSLGARSHNHQHKSSRNYTMHHSSSSLDMWQSFPCSWEGKKMLSISPLLSSSERWILGEVVGWNTGQSLSSSSSLFTFSDVFPSTVGPTWPVNWLSKLKITVPGLWTWTGPKETLTSRESTWRNYLIDLQKCVLVIYRIESLKVGITQTHNSCTVASFTLFS